MLAVGSIVSFIVSMLVLTLVLKILDAVCKRSVLGMVNRLLGAIVGLPSAIITVWVLSLVLLFAFPALLEGTSFATWLCSEFFLSKFFGIGA